MNWKKILIRLGIGLFLLLNVIAFNHAWHFSHFSSPGYRRTQKPEDLSALERIGVLFSGISNPKPRIDELPSAPYTTHLVPSHRDHRLSTWFFPVDSARGTVLLFHGYTGKKSDLLDEARAFRKAGWNTVLVDFYGSGDSNGNACSIGFWEAEDVKHVYRYFESRGHENLVLFGTSMGAVSVLKAVADDQLKPKAMILESPYESLLQTVRNRFELMNVPSYGLAELLVFWGGWQHGFWGFGMNSSSFAYEIDSPCLLLQGQNDLRASTQGAQSIVQKLRGHKRLYSFQGAGHQSFLTHAPETWEKEVISFLEGSGKTDKTQTKN